MEEFVLSKVKNMRDMLRPYVKTDAHRELMSKYNDKDILTLIPTHLLPLYALNTLDIARDTIVNELNIDDPVISAKIGRYLLCFCESYGVKKA
jgi:hypothetical protein